jgi:hypothetical protein
MLEIGHYIAIHETMAPDPIMNGNTATGDKLAGHALLVLNRFPLHFNYHQGVARLIVNRERFSPGNPKFIFLFLSF